MILVKKVIENQPKTIKYLENLGKINDSGQKGDKIPTQKHKIPLKTLVKSTFPGNHDFIKSAKTL